MAFNESIREEENCASKVTQDKAKKKATEHAMRIMEFIGWLFILNSDEVEILINDEHKLLIMNGIREGKKFIYRYFFFGCNEWNDNGSDDWNFYKTEYIKQLKIELPKIKWNNDVVEKVLARIYKNDIWRN